MKTLIQYLPLIAVILAVVTCAWLVIDKYTVTKTAKRFGPGFRLLRYNFGTQAERLMANIGEGTHEGSITRKADAALAKHLLVKAGTDANHVAVCGAGDVPYGPVDDEADAAEDIINVLLLGSAKQTVKCVAVEGITAGELVFTAAGGKVQDEPAGAGTYYQVGVALTTVTTDGDIIEVDPVGPIKFVVPTP